MIPPIKRGTAARLGLRHRQYVDIYLGDQFQGRISRELYDEQVELGKHIGKFLQERMAGQWKANKTAGQSAKRNQNHDKRSTASR